MSKTATNLINILNSRLTPLPDHFKVMKNSDADLQQKLLAWVQTVEARLESIEDDTRTLLKHSHLP